MSAGERVDQRIRHRETSVWLLSRFNFPPGVQPAGGGGSLTSIQLTVDNRALCWRSPRGRRLAVRLANDTSELTDLGSLVAKRAGSEQAAFIIFFTRATFYQPSTPGVIRVKRTPNPTIPW